jgi:hypothetical protein
MDNLELLRWRESRALALEDQALAEAFSSRAADVHAQVTFLLSQGFSEGANKALSAMAEGDMVDFCVMVDLASAVVIPGVARLNEHTRIHLQEFLDQEPWRSLAVDNDITIALATIEDLLERMANGETWYRVSPQLPVTLATLMDRVDREQFMRFAGELTDRQQRVRNAAERLRFLNEIIIAGAHRVGVRPPTWLQPSG